MDPVEVIEEQAEELEEEMRTREKMRDTQMKERLSKAQLDGNQVAPQVPHLNVQRTNVPADGSQ